MPFQQNGCVIAHSGDAVDGEQFAVELDDKSILHCTAIWRGVLWSAQVDPGNGIWPARIDQMVIERGGLPGNPHKILCLLRGSRFSVETCVGKIMFNDVHVIGLVQAGLAAA